MRYWFFEQALLPEGWARDVSLSVEAGEIVDVRTGVAPGPDDRRGGIALPGLPNVHSHAFQRGMAGLAETRGREADSFWTWREVMYRFLDRLTPDDVEAIAAFAFAEMLEAGFTAVGEFHYLHHDPAGRPYAEIAELSQRIAAAAGETGIGLTLLPVLYAFGGFGGRPPEPGQRRFVNDPGSFARLVEGARAAVEGLPDAVVGVAPHSLRAVDAPMLATAVELAGGAPIHIHVAEQEREVADCLASTGQRPVEWLMANADVGRSWCLIHATHMEPPEIAAVARSGAVAGLCPLTEASLGDGIFPGEAFLRAGGRFGVGSDSNVEIGAAQELKQLEYGQRLALQRRNVLSGPDGGSTGGHLYRSALAGGRQALGRRIGALSAGSRAEIVVLDPDHPSLAGMAGDRILDAYVFVAGAALIETVIVGGEIVVSGGRHVRRDAIARRFVASARRLAMQ